MALANGSDMAKNTLEDTKKLMGALVRMKPKPHEELKIRKKAKAKIDAKRSKSKRRV